MTTTLATLPTSRDRIADETAVTVRDTLSPDLLALRDLRRADVVAPHGDTEDDQGLARYIAQIQLAEIEREIARRERASRIDAGIPTPSDIRYQAWADVAAVIRDTVPVPDVLHHLGWPTKRTGRDKEGRDELHSACPFCGGEDRFIAWGLPRSRWMCRQCSEGRAEDVITLWRNCKPGIGFRRACEDLAGIAGVVIP